MSDILTILGSSGPVTLDELSLRSSETPKSLISKINALKAQGMISISGPHAEELASLSDDQIAGESATVVSLTRRAFAAGR